MMNKKLKRYVLLFVALLVWGLIGYRVYEYFNPEEITVENFTPQKFIPKKIKETEKYTIKANYRDPFLGVAPTKKKKKIAKKVIKNNQPFPSVVYNGVIEANRTKSYIITINGQQEVFKIGQTFNNVKLLSANAKQIKVRNNGVNKTIQLN